MDKKFERKYLPEFVYGGIDGSITTFAIVSGALGASLSPAIILILGFANLFADGFSMAVSNYLSTKSLSDLNYNHKDKKPNQQKAPHKTALVTFFSFLIVGFIPLLSFVLAMFIPYLQSNAFIYSIILTAIAFLTVGAIKGLITKRHPLYSSILTLVIGSLAAAIAFIVGYLLRELAT